MIMNSKMIIIIKLNKEEINDINSGISSFLYRYLVCKNRIMINENKSVIGKSFDCIFVPNPI